MTQERMITGSTTEEVWDQINSDFETLEDVSHYHVLINHAGTRIALDIDIDLGGGFEGGYEVTSITAAIPDTTFRFAIHPQDFVYEIGKLFGIQDVTIGYPEFDKNVIVKTNDDTKVKKLFADSEVREAFQDLSGYSLGITEGDKEQLQLELNIQRGIIDASELLVLYSAYYKVLEAVVKG
ncbi:hypothetical protein [Filimonas effusa]|uniref:Uncharacterized protein n=1 Tax=Filimonas effusa TaxID=2508721 RepID=A0A4Q1D6P0_9BACT|nr:hypothetical protein [Filimonas effusa]RXK83666.1 hypothetical protein ESB13_16425 [Filimonas effusa]